MTDKQMQEFVALVATMREAQNAYFKRGGIGLLQTARKLEAQVDCAVKTLTPAEPGKNQSGLFPEAPEGETNRDRY